MNEDMPGQHVVTARCQFSRLQGQPFGAMQTLCWRTIVRNGDIVKGMSKQNKLPNHPAQPTGSNYRRHAVRRRLSLYKTCQGTVAAPPKSLLLVEGCEDLSLELVGNADAGVALGAGLGGGLLLVVNVLVGSRLVRLDGVAGATPADVVVLALGRGAVGLLGDEVLVGARGGLGLGVGDVSGSCGTWDGQLWFFLESTLMLGTVSASWGGWV